MAFYGLLTFTIPSFIEFMVNCFGQFTGLILPVISDIIIIFACNKYVVMKKNDFVSPTNELFIYFPIQSYHNFGGKLHGTKFLYPKKSKGDLLKGVQESNLIIHPKELNGISFAFTFNGEIVINEQSLKILNNHELTGFQVCPVHDLNNNQINNYFQM
ncbi:MAG: hypothetical protein LBU81_01335 [Methanosarcinales archaeon]|jgi:hypothetical protein|nr:hypothetical protein [Methanosarcinales archaeon]